MPKGVKAVQPKALPGWLRAVASDSRLRSDDVAKIFGYERSATLIAAVAQHRFPAPDERHFRPGGKRPVCLWYKSTVVAEFNRRAKNILEEGQKTIDT